MPSPSTLPRTAVVAAAGSADGARGLAAAGADLIVAYHSSAYRAIGLPSVAGLLPWASANEQTLAMLPGVQAGAGNLPIGATVMASDPFRPPREMLTTLAGLGVAAVLNAPTVGLFTGAVRDELERNGLGYGRELDLIEAAASAGLGAIAYVFDESTAVLAADRGASALVLHLGITGGVPVPSAQLAERVMAVASRAAAAGIPALVHGGPLDRPSALVDLRAQVDAEVGFFGARVFDSATAPDVDAWRPEPHRTTTRRRVI